MQQATLLIRVFESTNDKDVLMVDADDFKLFCDRHKTISCEVNELLENNRGTTTTEIMRVKYRTAVSRGLFELKELPLLGEKNIVRAVVVKLF